MCDTLVVLESGWMKGIPFLLFGVQEAFATQLGQKCNMQHDKRGWFYDDFAAGVDDFLERSVAFVRNNPVPREHVRAALGVASLVHGKKRMELVFGLIAVFREKRMIGLCFEPSGPHADMPEEFDEWIEEKYTYVATLDPSNRLSIKDRRRVYTTTDVVMHGFDIGMGMYEWSRRGVPGIDDCVRH